MPLVKTYSFGRAPASSLAVTSSFYLLPIEPIIKSQGLLGGVVLPRPVEAVLSAVVLLGALLCQQVFGAADQWLAGNGFAPVSEISAMRLVVVLAALLEYSLSTGLDFNTGLIVPVPEKFARGSLLVVLPLASYY